MSLREAAEAALEMLEQCSEHDYGHRCIRCDSEIDPDWRIRDALRAALAEAEAPGNDAEHFHRVMSQLGKAACRVDDLVTLCNRLCRALKHIAPTHTLLAQVDEYLRRERLTGSPLRDRTEAPKAEPVELSDEEIIRMWQEHAFWPMPEIKDVVSFARAVLAQGRKG